MELIDRRLAADTLRSLAAAIEDRTQVEKIVALEHRRYDSLKEESVTIKWNRL